MGSADIAFQIRVKKEQEEEQKRMEKAEAHLYTIIKVARDEDLLEQIGRDLYFDLVDHDKVRSFRVRKQMPFILFKEEVAKEFGIPVQSQRFWMWAQRQNHTYRPYKSLTPQEEAHCVGQLREVSNKANNAELKLFLEIELGQDLRPVPLPKKAKENILLFFKLYNPLTEEFRYVGRLFVMGSGKPEEILEKLNELADFAPNEEIELFEEIKFEPRVMCERINKELTFRGSQLENGDIICFQKSLQVESSKQCRYPDVPSFLEYLHNRQVVHFRSLKKPKEDEFCLEFSKLHNYDNVVERVARHLDVDDPSNIRLTSHNCHSQKPKTLPIKYSGVENLSDMLVHSNQRSDILYYEVLNAPELEGLKSLKVSFHHATKDEVMIHTIKLPKQSTVEDVINDLKTKVELSHQNAELRLLEVFYHKIYKIFPLNQKIKNIDDQYWTIRAEEIPEEEKNLGPHHKLIHVYHFMKNEALDQEIHNFGEPFLLVINKRETLAIVKVRIQRKLQVPDEEFLQWKFASVSLGRPKYLQDSDIVHSQLKRRDVCGAWDQYLGLEHSENVPKRSPAANQNQHTSEKQWRGYEVATEFIPILERIGALYPNAYKNFSCKSPTFQTFVLNSLAQTLLDMQKCRVGDLNAVEVAKFQMSFRDLELAGLDVSWMSSRVDHALKVVDSVQLYKDLTEIEKQLEEARGTIRRLEQDHAHLTAQIKIRVGDAGVAIGPDHFVADGLI